MPNALIDADLLTEAARDLIALAQALHPGADAEHHAEIAFAALGALVPAAPDAWLELTLERALES